MTAIPSDVTIARNAHLNSIESIAEQLEIPLQAIYRYGPYKAKIDLDYLANLNTRPDNRLILVTAITPTAAGEGKTTTTIGLADALSRIGKKTVICLREPSLGPCFGIKGGAAGGGYSQLAPMEDINLHFTGDFHAISTAHNLLSALIDNHIHWGNQLRLDTCRITWRRALDMNDRALRRIVVALGSPNNGIPREDGFDIVAASEIMAIFCLTRGYNDLYQHLAAIIVGRSQTDKPIRAQDLKAAGPMTVLLKDALSPNLVQSLENTPALVHGGPFANIAHGCNSLIATQAGIALSDYVVTEAGFGADLGAEKFFNIKCRKAGLQPAATVIVATLRALKMHGDRQQEDWNHKDIHALDKGLGNLARHIKNVESFGIPLIVAINRFTPDDEAELTYVRDCVAQAGHEAVICDHWAQGGRGAEELAHKVIELAKPKSSLRMTYPDKMPLIDKIHRIVTRIYGASDVVFSPESRRKLCIFEEEGYDHLPICMAKTQYSFSIDPKRKGAPEEHVITINDVKLLAGAGFIVAICGDMLTMPGLSKHPAASSMTLNEKGQITGLF